MSAPSSHRFVDHTSEVGLQVRAGSFGELLAEAGRGLARLLLREVPRTAAGETRDFEVFSHDREALLVDWLNELLFVAETRLWVPLEFEVLEASETRIRARVRGAAVEVPPSIVKAATFHGLQVKETADGFAAEVILDV
jgi:SHS2 domain-containing protein